MEAVQLFQEVNALGERVAILEHRMAEQQKRLVLLSATRDAVDFLASVESALVPECFAAILVQVEVIRRANGGVVTLAVAQAAISQAAISQMARS